MHSVKIPSEMEVAPRLTLLTLFTLNQSINVYSFQQPNLILQEKKAFTVATVYTVYTIQTALHCLNSGMFAHIYC